MIAELSRLREQGWCLRKSGIINTYMWTIFFLIFLALVLGVAAWLLFLWAVKSGQYDDPEGPKHRMMDDEDDRRK